MPEKEGCIGIKKTFELKSRNKRLNRKTAKIGQINKRNYTNFEMNLGMMLIYVSVKFELVRTNCF